MSRGCSSSHSRIRSCRPPPRVRSGSRTTRAGLVGTFPREGAEAAGVTYAATVEAEASEDDIVALMRHTDTVAEIQNTVRRMVDVSAKQVTAISSPRTS